MKQIIGKKIGMVSLFDINGKIIPATIIYCEPNVVLENKGKEAKHGANLLKVGAFEANEKKMNKAEAGIFKKLNLAPNKEIRTIKTDQNLNVGDKITVDSFVSGEFVDVQGTTKGRGFTGAIFR
jgi:large subunit ribosomal protein L3